MNPMEKYLEGKWRIAIKGRDGGKCRICGLTYGLEVHHIFRRSIHSTKFEIDNGITLCFRHHHLLAHADPETFKQFIQVNFGEGRYEILWKKSKEILHFDKEFFKDKKAELNKFLDDMEGVKK